MTILLDPGHGSDTPGKRSPYGRFLEYAFNRDIAARVASKLTTLGLNTEIIVPELTDIPLKERVSRINSRCAALGKGNVILVSIHANAAGNGSKWMNARADGAATLPRATLLPMRWPPASAKLPPNISKTSGSAPTSPTETPTSKNHSISSATPPALQYSSRTSSMTIRMTSGSWSQRKEGNS